MTDLAALTIGLVGAGICLFVLWRGRGVGRRAADAETDAETGLLDRRRFDRDVDAHATRGGEPCAVLFVDIDRRTAGHADARRIVAAVVASTVRGGDVAYRYRDDVFAVLLPATEVRVAARVAERIRSAVANADAGAAGPLTVAIGVAAGSPRRVDEIVDRALAAATTAAHNRVSIA